MKGKIGSVVFFKYETIELLITIFKIITIHYPYTSRQIPPKSLKINVVAQLFYERLSKIIYV